MVDFRTFDRRRYRTVDVKSGYGQWVATYEQTVEDTMDIELLEALDQPRWEVVDRAADLGCGTGRIGAWLRDKGVPSIDGVDLTPEMLAVAERRGIYDRLIEADISSTRLPSEDYDLVTTCLVDDHLAELGPLYSEASRLAGSGAIYVLVGYHPDFIMAAGVPTHFDSATGEPVAIETHVHLLSEQLTAGLAAGWTLVEVKERIIDDAWLALKPRWQPFRGRPISFALVWRKHGPNGQ
jgi:SAM-dependent methyltransferase